MFKEQENIKREPDFFVLLEYLKLLKHAIADMDIDTSDEIIRQMQSFQYSGETGKKMEQLALSVAEIAPERTVLIAEELEMLFMQEM